MANSYLLLILLTRQCPGDISHATIRILFLIIIQKFLEKINTHFYHPKYWLKHYLPAPICVITLQLQLT